MDSTVKLFFKICFFGNFHRERVRDREPRGDRDPERLLRSSRDRLLKLFFKLVYLRKTL